MKSGFDKIYFFDKYSVCQYIFPDTINENESKCNQSNSEKIILCWWIRSKSSMRAHLKSMHNINLRKERIH